MARASLWEDTIILALRDLQWSLHVQAIQSTNSAQGGVNLPRSLPPRLLKLDGRAESKLSDVVTAFSKDTFFIFEVKSTFSKIRDEWRKKSQKKTVSKLAYKTLTKLVSEENREFRLLRGRESNLAGRQVGSGFMLRMGQKPSPHVLHSLRGHHFVAWSIDDSSGASEGDVYITPYILCASDARNDEDKLKESVMKPLLWRCGFHHQQKVFRRIPLKNLQGSKIVFPDEGHNPKLVLDVGLSAKEFSQYVEYLCKSASGDGVDAGHEDIHMVLFSAPGGFMKILRKTDELAQFVLDGYSPPRSHLNL